MAVALPWIARTLALLAAGLAGFLWWSGSQATGVVGCDAFGAFDCDAALASRWAKWFGQPVALGGLACYIVAFLGAVLAGSRGAAGAAGWRLLEAAVPLAIGAGVWFMAVQLVALESLCLYCVATHLAGLLLGAVVVLWRRSASNHSVGPTPIGMVGFAAPTAPARPDAAAPPSLGAPTLVSVLGLVTLVAGQTLFAPSSVAEFEAELTQEVSFGSPAAPEPGSAPDEAAPDEAAPDEPAPEPEGPAAPPTRQSPKLPAGPQRKAGGSRMVTFLKGRLKVDAYDHATLGSPEAPHLVLELMDYACPHCREFHERLTEALGRFQGQVAVIVMPVPGEISCNPYVQKARPKSAGACYAAKLSLAVSRLEPERFPAFHEWMLHDDAIPSRTASLIEAQRHVDANDLSTALRDDEGTLAGRIKNYVELSALIGRQQRFGLPAQVVGDKVFAGPVESIDKLCEAWAKELGLEEPKSDIPF